MIRALTVLASLSRGAVPCEGTRIAGREALVARPGGGEVPAVVYAKV